MEYADKRSRRALKDLHDLPFPALAVQLLPCHGHAHDVAVKCSSGLGCLHEHIFLISFHNHESIAFTGHLHLSDSLRKHLPFLLSATSCAGIPLSCHKLYNLSHKISNNINNFNMVKRRI